MFTGIVQAVSQVARLEPRAGDARLYVGASVLGLEDVRPGDSIAVNGVCLTVVDMGQGGFSADVSRETLALTTLGSLRAGSAVNLEKALTLSTPLGGHLVSGHVDGVGEVREVREDARSWRLRIEAPPAIARYIAAKGSICIDGTSLTVNRVEGASFEVNIVPHTLQATIIRKYKEGSKVNLEVDLIARYLERLLLAGQFDETSAPVGLTRHFLTEHGFLRD